MSPYKANNFFFVYKSVHVVIGWSIEIAYVIYTKEMVHSSYDIYYISIYIRSKAY